MRRDEDLIRKDGGKAVDFVHRNEKYVDSIARSRNHWISD